VCDTRFRGYDPRVANQVMTVGDLVNTTSLESRVLAGADGLDRQVLWAHSCEMQDPADWLRPHEMLMTVGLCVPKRPAEQVRFIRRLNDAGLAAVMIGDHDTAPPLSKEMLAEANRCGMPILLAGAHTSYSVVARHVAAANTTSQTFQVLTLSKIYYITAAAGDDPRALLAQLEALLEIALEIRETRFGLAVLPGRPAPGDTDSAHTYPLRGTHTAELVIHERRGHELDGFILVHLLKVLEVTVDRLLDQADRRSELSARLLTSTLNGEQSTEAEAFLAPHALATGYHAASFDDIHGQAVARAITLARLPVLVGSGTTGIAALIPTPELNAVRSIAAEVGATVGASSLFFSREDARTAAMEAHRVLNDVGGSDAGWAEFERAPVSVLSRSHREAQEIVESVLGPLASMDPKLVLFRETLFAFLRNDRQWAVTADELGIHRQTLAYRLGRIEQLTGATLAHSADLSAMWIAYQAWEAIRPSA
jgi:PucR family transcriptional regulator, purine catabolism regulatory protein